MILVGRAGLEPASGGLKESDLEKYSLSIRLLQHTPICIRSYAQSQENEAHITRRYAAATYTKATAVIGSAYNRKQLTFR